MRKPPPPPLGNRRAAKPEGQAKSEVLKLRLKPAQMRQLRELALKRGITVAELSRSLLVAQLETYDDGVII